MTTPASEQLTTTAQQFVEQYKVTPPFFVRHCLLPSLWAVTQVSCFHRGTLVETLEVPAWKTRLRALRTMFAVMSAKETAGKQIKIPSEALGPAELATIVDGFLEADCCPTNLPFLLVSCLK